MKVLHVIDSGGLYGAEVMLLNLAAEQAAMGLEPIIASIGDPLCDEKPLEKEAVRRGLRVERFRMRPGPNIAGAFSVLRFAWREQCDVLHSHGYKGNILFGFMPRALRRLPMVTTLHGWTWTGGMDRMGLYEWLDRLSLRFVDAVVMVNDAMRRKIDLPGIHVVPNGIPLAGEAERPAVPLDPRIVEFCRGGITLGAIGRLSPEKGFDILLDAVREVAETNPGVRLALLGEGVERDALEAKIRELGLTERVLLPGYVPDANRYLPLFRAFVLSSLTEGLPMVILEAMLAGVPIVATRVGGVPEVLQEGEAGVLVPAPSAGDLATGIKHIIADEAGARDMAAVARQRLEANYSAIAMAQKYQGIYDRLATWSAGGHSA
ncbi:glycosyltransferase [Geobacter sulfurreducens]|uniref:glycosyltransferase n=1 Tax=Geobacter sulfurreducens TaxID=35554 RepID=UPI002D1DDDC5|nr:glycosyltransferase [Geobacter sulfurreducens]HML78001.1 glycosyltransferase [Geobacter sulfurreducens]